MLTRFRVDPRKVRVSIQRAGQGWRYTVSRAGIQASAVSKWPILAMMRALRAAQRLGLKGIDLGMQWAYEHPMKPGV